MTVEEYKYNLLIKLIKDSAEEVAINRNGNQYIKFNYYKFQENLRTIEPDLYQELLEKLNSRNPW